MCGVVGIFNPQGGVSEHELLAMDKLIDYRGPDDHGAFLDRGVGLAHRRLTILDLTTKGHQPMSSADGRYVISYNGEIYNFARLRTELEERKIQVSSTGDTEPLLEHISAFGLDDTLSKMEGMFAFALWDRELGTVTLVRDRHGIKPMYYQRSAGGTLRFASEMKCLLDGSSQVDISSLHSMILGLDFPPSSHSLFRGINSVEPGTYVRFDRELRESRRSFFRVSDFADPDKYRKLQASDPKEIVEMLDQALQRSTELRMISDVPVASLISGGIDSALVSALARSRLDELKLFHADVVGASEREEAETFAREMGCEFYAVTVTPDDMLDYAPEVTYHFEHPIVQLTNAVPFYLVSRLVSEHGIKVLLTGEGSDEYFIGYAKNVAHRFLSGLQSIKGRARKIVHRVPTVGRMIWPAPEAGAEHHIGRLLLRYELDEQLVRGAEVFQHVDNQKERDWSTLALTLVDDVLVSLLARNDRLAMAWGLESRFPFLGHEVASLALNLPSRFKVHRGLRLYNRKHPFLVDKWVVRQVGRRYVSTAARKPKYVFGGGYESFPIEPELFEDGFLAELYGLSAKRARHLADSTPPLLRARFMLIELWGQLFARRKSVDETRAWLRAHVKVPKPN
jgi:asparagine synthase (glutamine-hydrolysing)